jgi:RNA polymerase sigma-70 factor (ECF subfamily)
MGAMLADTAEVPDELLIGRARDGDRDAFGMLVERHYDFIHRVAYRWAGNRTDAEDIAQDVCLRLGRAIRSYRGGAAFTTWLYAVVLSAARDFSRSSRRESARIDAFGVHALVSPATAEPMAERQEEEKADELWAAVRRLPDKQREAVTLVYGEGLDHAAVADVMGLAEATVSWHVHEARKRLKRMLLAGED